MGLRNGTHREISPPLLHPLVVSRTDEPAPVPNAENSFFRPIYVMMSVRYTPSMSDEITPSAAISPLQPKVSPGSTKRRGAAPGMRRGLAARDWLIPASLILLSLVPVAAGAFRLTELAGAAEVTPDNARFFANPLPVVLHIFSASIFSVLGAFQFAPGLRRRNLRWHRRAGRLLIPLGLAAGGSGLWLTLAYPFVPPSGLILYIMRLVVGSAMVVFIGLAVLAIARRDYSTHGAWMIRGYAIGIGAGTQALTHGVLYLVGGPFNEVGIATAMGAGWAINLVVAEWLIRKPLVSRRRLRPLRD